MRAYSESSAAGESFTATLTTDPTPMVTISTESGCLELLLTLEEATSLVEALLPVAAESIHRQVSTFLEDH